jgi:glycosyltransferase involved in cell wall biosynthesis
MTRPAMCIVTTIPMPMKVFMGPHIRALANRFQITLVANGAVSDFADLLSPHVRFESLALKRGIGLWSDLRSLLTLWRLFRRERFVVVQSMMPKSGLLAMIAASLANVPARIHWFTGQVWANRNGASRQLLKAMDRLLATCATHLLADSRSQRDYLVAEGIVNSKRITVLRQGSVCGVDTARFRPNAELRRLVRSQLGIGESAIVALFLGRLNADKGVPELADAFAVAARECPESLHLLLVGPDEADMRKVVSAKLSLIPERIHFADVTDQPEAFMASADYFVLPSHREGFGSTVIEAAACGIPTIATRIYGLTDSVVDEVTGLLVPDFDSGELAGAMVKLTLDRRLRLDLGRRAMQRVHADFQQEQLVAAASEFYENVWPSADVD